MPSNCVICGNSAMKDPGVSFHRLPSNTERKRLWLEAFEVTEEEWCQHWRVCSRHFPGGNPRSAPRTHQEDQFATPWAFRKRTKLGQGRRITSRHVRGNRYVDTILAMRAQQGALPCSLPTPAPAPASAAGVNTCTNNTSSAPRTVGTVHARSTCMPMLVSVTSLAELDAATASGGGSTTVLTSESLVHPPSPTQPHTHQLEAAGIHIHELVVPHSDPADIDTYSSSESSDERIPRLECYSEADTVVTVSGVDVVTVSGVDGVASRDVDLESGVHHDVKSEFNHIAESGVDHVVESGFDHVVESGFDHVVESGFDHVVESGFDHIVESGVDHIATSMVVDHDPECNSALQIDRDTDSVTINPPLTVHRNHSASRVINPADHNTRSVVSHAATVDDATPSGVDHPVSRVEDERTSDPSSSDTATVLVHSALLAHARALNTDNQLLRRKLLPTSPLCVHVTDCGEGRPAEGMTVELTTWQSSTADWTALGSGVTGDDGQCSSLLSQPQLGPGLYRLHFDSHSYLTSQGHTHPYHPYIEVVFRLQHSTSHHHVSLQLSPFSYTTSSHCLTAAH